MADAPGSGADEPAKASRSAAKKDAAKKLAALWKKQLKLLKAKDPDKKREGLSFCAQNPRFFREQPEVLPTLLALLARLKAPDIVLDTLTTFETLLFPVVGDAKPGQQHSEDTPNADTVDDETLMQESKANALFVIQSSLANDAGYEGGQPFVALFTATAASHQTKTKAISFYERLLEVTVAQSATEPGETTAQALLNYQTVGSPVAALLVCLESSEVDLQFAALSCLAQLLGSDRDDNLLTEFSSKGGYTHVLRLGQHVERRFHTVVLGILDTLSRGAAGRGGLMAHGALEALDQMLKEAVDALANAAAAIMASGPAGSATTPDDAARMGCNIPLMSQVFARVQFGVCLSDTSYQTPRAPGVDPSAACFSFIDSMLTVLQKDIGSAKAALASSTVPSPPPVTGNAATVAAAAAAAANAAAAAALFTFDCDRVVIMLSSLGRMIERSEQCKAHSYSKQVIGIAFDCFKLPGQAKLHQVADKLLHQCCVDGDYSTVTIPRDVPVSKPIFQSSTASASGEANGQTVTDAGVSVEAVATLLESLYAASDHASIFRLVRWLALLVEVPENARSLGDHCAAVLLKIFTRCQVRQHLLVGFLAKVIGATMKANPSALESCGFEGADPVPQLVAYLRQASPELLANDQDAAGGDQGEPEVNVDSLVLEWIDEQEEEGVFQPMVLTEARHAIDPFLNASQALLGILQGFEAANPADWSASDFWDLFAQREALAGGHQSKPSPAIGTGAAAPSKKRLDTPKAGIIGEATVLSILCSGREVLNLVPDFAGTNAVVCVALLSLFSKLLMLRGGSRILLRLVTSEKNAATSRIDEEDSNTSPQDDNVFSQGASWPIGTEACIKSAHTALLKPLMSVLRSFATSFDEVEAAVQVTSILTGDPDVEGGRHEESFVQETDRFVTCAVACGALVVLVAYLDGVRIPNTSLQATSGSDKLGLFITQVERLLLRFTNWGRLKQETTAKMNGVEQAPQPTSSDGSTAEEHIHEHEASSYEKLWAERMLDLRFDIPRFGYSNYSALLLATEIGQTDIAVALLNAGASATTSSSAGATPLMLAALNRQEALAHELCRHEADLDAITSDGRDQTVWLCALVSSPEAHKLISDTYAAAAASVSDSTVDALPLLMALDTIHGSPVALRELMRSGMDVNVSDANGNFPLHAVLSKAHVRQKLRGIDLCFRYDSRLTDAGDITTLITALVEEHGADVHKVNRLGQTPLHMALLYGHSAAARLLLRHGANPNVLDVHGYLPLHYASCGFCGEADGSGDTAVELIQLLLEASVKFPVVVGTHIDDRKYKTASEKLALEIEEKLIAGLLSVTQPSGIVSKLASRDEIVIMSSTTDGFFPWHMACGAFTHSPATFPLDDAMTARFTTNGSVRCAILRYFVESCGVDTAKPAHKGLTTLHLAIKSAVSSCNDEVIELLLADCQAADKPKRLDINAVHDVATIDSLPPLAIGSEVTVVGVDPPEIHGFVSSRSAMNPNEYHVLMSNGVHVEAVDRQRLRLADSSTACNIASKRYYLFIESCFTALHYALQTSDALSRRLLAVPELTQEVEGIDIPFLALACAAHRSADVVKPLIGPSANVRVKLPLITSSVNFRTGSSSGAGSRKKHAAALHYAVMYEDVPVARELVSSSHVNVNVRRSGDGFTPLHLACEIGNVEIVKLLLEHGANVGQESSSSLQDSVTPLQLLVKNGTFADDTVRELVLEQCQDLRLLFGDFAGPSDASEWSKAAPMPDDSVFNQEEAHGTGEATCFLLNLEHQNLQLYDRIQQLRSQRRAASDLLARKLEIDLSKFDRVLIAFFELIQSHCTSKHPVSSVRSTHDSKPDGLDAALLFTRLPHPHECFRQYEVRSAWTEAAETASNQANAAVSL